jgi:hypothetical protein
VPVPRRQWRKVVAGVQGVTLAFVVSGLVPTVVGAALLLVALGLLAESFGRDVVWLSRRHHGMTAYRRASAAVPSVVQLARTTGG